MIPDLQGITIYDALSDYNIGIQQNNKLQCPFPDHKESEASFLVYPKNNSFYCFGCKRGGSIIDFVMAMEGVAAGTAILMLKQRHGIENNFEELIQKRFQQFLDFTLLNTKKSNQYLETRNIDLQLASRLEIGYCPLEVPKMSQELQTFYMQQKILKPEFPSGVSWNFADRLTIPVRNSVGRIVGFIGRALSSEQEPRYINSHFKKSEILYNLNLAKPYIFKSQEIIIVEGVFDVLSLLSQKIYNVVSTLGSIFSIEQQSLVPNFVKTVLCYDGDDAGKNGMIKAGECRDVFCSMLPDGEDIADLHKQGKLLQTVIDNVVALHTAIGAEKGFEIELKNKLVKTGYVSIDNIYALGMEYGLSNSEAYAIYLSCDKFEPNNKKYGKTQRWYKKVKYA